MAGLVGLLGLTCGQLCLTQHRDVLQVGLMLYCYCRQLRKALTAENGESNAKRWQNRATLCQLA